MHIHRYRNLPVCYQDFDKMYLDKMYGAMKSSNSQVIGDRQETNEEHNNHTHATHLHIDLPHAHSIVSAPARNECSVT